MYCSICLRDKSLTKHHLIPKSRHKNKKTLKRHDREDSHKTIDICRECHNQLHACLSEKEMDEDYFTFDKVLQHTEIAKFTEWVRKRQPAGKISVKRNKKRK